MAISSATRYGDIESNPGPGSDSGVRVLYSNNHCLHANLVELAVAISDYGVLVCAESKVSDRRQLSIRALYPWLWLPPTEA